MYRYTCTYVQDGLVVPRALMAKYTADGALSFGLRVEEGSKADVVTVISASIEFGICGCYTRHAIAVCVCVCVYICMYIYITYRYISMYITYI